MFNKLFTKPINIIILAITLSGSFLIGIILANQNKKDLQTETLETQLEEVIKRPHRYLGFESSNESLSSHISQYNKIDSIQGSFKLTFDGFEIFNQVGIINTAGNISGVNPNTPMRIIEENSDTSIPIEDTDYSLIATTNTQQFFGVYEYHLVDISTKENADNISTYEVETSILTNPNLDKNTYFETNVITFKVRETNEQERKEQIKDAINNFLSLNRTNGFVIPNQENITSPYGDMEYTITQGFSDEHQAIDLKYNKRSKNRSPLYDLMGEVPIVAVCNGVASGTISDTQALVITITCENGEVIEYWHNSANLIYPNQPVLKGDLIGFEGDTGNSDGAHLHLVWKIDGDRKNPALFLESLKQSIPPVKI